MNINMLLRNSLRSLRKHMGRTILTTLGIILGVIAIISVMAIGEGAKSKVKQEIERLGTNFIIALSSSQKKLSQRGSGTRQPTFTMADFNAIKKESEYINQISRGLGSITTATNGNTSWQTQITGVDANYTQIREWRLDKGFFFTKSDVASNAKVAVLGQTTAASLFGVENPVGRKIRIKRIPFHIIGVLVENGKRPDGQDEDDIIIIPITTLIKRIMGTKEKYYAFIMSAKKGSSLFAAAEEVRSILRQKHKVKKDTDEDFTIFSQDDMQQASEAASRILNLLLLFVASISLIVGGIGIMNIMLVTVTERTKEIGIRMALGATTQHILTQFLLEAITICFLGGLIGVSLGVGLSFFIGNLIGWPIFIPLKSVFISLVSCVLIGLFFGFYPAYKASHLNPVEALIER